VAGGACDATCEKHLYLQRQLRESLGKDKDRLDWVWLVPDARAVKAELLPAIKQATVLRVDAACSWRSGWRRPGPRAARPPVCGGPDGQLDDALSGREPGRDSGHGLGREDQARPGAADARLRVVGQGGPALMDAQPLYDLAPAARLMLMGVVIALGPLAWVWLRNRDAEPARRLRTLTLLTLFLTFDLVLFGAFTRLTDSGLGCPDWPGCYGNASPVGARAKSRRRPPCPPAR
jgi:hypothetical protein